MKKGRKFNGREGRDYTVVFRGGVEENEANESEDFAWQVVDLLVLSVRARKAQIEGRKNPYEDVKKRIEFDDKFFAYLGERVQIRIHGVQVDPENPDDRYPFKATSPPFTFGDLSDFQRVYIKGLIKVLKKFGSKRSPWPIYTRQISIAFADGHRLPGNARQAANQALKNEYETSRNPFGTKSKKATIRTSTGKTSERSRKSSGAASNSTAKRGRSLRKKGTK